MNADTIRTINEIKKNGYYRDGTGLGEGGWAEVYKFCEGYWLAYHLANLEIGETVCSIHAKDDKAAVKAFASMFRVDEFEHEITQETRTYRIVSEI